jgi:hypothetical protein
MNRFVVLLLGVIGIGASAQTQQIASPCDLVHDPAKFANQIVRVRGTVSLAFEDFTLETPDCGEGKDHRPVWLMYGGDEPTPTASTVNDLSRPSGTVLKVEGRPITLRRDADLDLFVRRLVAERTVDVTGKNCYDNCRLYRVTATLTGVFFAAQKEALGGYGHLGCCHLLAIQQVSDVEARRTPVPAGGRFVCSTETWKIGATEASALEEKRNRCSGFARCRSAAFDEIEIVAKHWDEHIAVTEDSHFEWGGDMVWHSPDLLTSYSLKTLFRDSSNNTGPIDGIAASRTVCKAESRPLPQSTPVGCRNLDSEFALTAKAAEANEATAKHDYWRMGGAEVAAQKSLVAATTDWGVIPKPSLNFTGCSKPMVVEGDKFSWCSWNDPEGMQSFSVQVMKFGAFRHGKGWESVPWILSRGNGLACAAE